jgi:hypothetical protein
MFLLERWGHRRATFRVGDRVWPGMRIAEVATPDKMTAEVYVLENDAGGLAVGQLADVVLEARPDITMKARVARVDPFPKQLDEDVPAQYFVTTLEIENATSGIKPGQRLRATLVLDRQESALVVPRQAVFRDDDEAIVYRQKVSGRGFDPVKVKLGPGTIGRVVIAEGLNVGDSLALRDPGRSVDETVSGSGKVQRRSGERRRVLR